MATDNHPITIEDMIAELWPPRNYAEQCILHRMRDDAERNADARARGRDKYEYATWEAALARRHAIAAMREWGNTPVIPGCYGVEDQKGGATVE